MPLTPNELRRTMSEADAWNQRWYSAGEPGWRMRKNNEEDARRKRRTCTGPPRLMERLYPSDDFDREEDYNL